MNRSSNMQHAVIVGAGPYGLSLAAHLREAGVPFRIFGQPMQSWLTQMPVGMKLKSDGFASNLSSGSVPFTLEDYCRLTGRPYHATDLPVALEDFVSYGQEFARRYVPTLEPRNVAHIDRIGGNFRVTLEGGEVVLASNVVLATGLSLFQYLPPDVAHLPSDMVTHTTAHRTFEEFENRDVVVLGRGASSLNAAALLHESGSRVTLLSRKHKIHIHSLSEPRQRPVLQRLLHPASPLGHSMRSWLASSVPGLFKALPKSALKVMFYKHLGPAGGTALHGRIQGKFPLLLGWTIASAEVMHANDPAERRIRLTLTNAELETREHITSHIIAGTGFRVDMKRYHFLADPVRNAIRSHDGGPALSHHFESSVKGLYLVGPVAQASFGPLLRFAAGAQYASAQVTERLQRSLGRQPRTAPAFTPVPVHNTVE